MVCFSLQAGSASAPIPGASLPTVTLGTAAVVGVGVHQVIVLPLDRGKGCQGVGDDFSVGHLGLGHWSRFVWYALVYRRGCPSDGPAVTVHPLSHTDRGQDGSAQDGTAGDPSESVLFRSTGEGHPNGASDGVACDLTSAGTVLRVDWEHWSRFVCGFSLDGLGASSAPACATRRGGRTVPGMRGRCERVTHRRGRRRPSAPPLPGWGTTVTATRKRCKGSGNELRFSFGWFVWYALVYRVTSAIQGQTVPAPKVAHALGGEVF